jgi:7-cyano-7-deazaguanine reductase
MKKDNTATLLKLGDHGKKYQYDSPDKSLLETFPNQFSNRQYLTQFIFNEFTSLCPKTGQPDFATITLEYIADKLCIETKSLKVYYLAYRNQGAFMETITNQILEDCFDVCNPIWMKVTSNFNARGGTLINVIAKKGRPNFGGLEFE